MTNKIDSKALWDYLAQRGKFDLIELLAKSDKKAISKIIINRLLVPDKNMHDAILSYLDNNGIILIRNDLKS